MYENVPLEMEVGNELRGFELEIHGFNPRPSSELIMKKMR
jgi:hypothetical protein